MHRSTSKNNLIASLASIVFIIAIVAIIAYVKHDNQIFPSISDIGSKIYQNIISKEVLVSFFASFVRLLIVLIISLIVSILLSLLYYYQKITMSFLKPLLAIMKTAPLAAISIYIFIIIKGGQANNLRPMIICFLVTMPVILEGCIASVDNIDQAIVNELSLTAGPKWFKFFKIYMPLMIPSIATTLLQTIGLGFKVIVMAEYLCLTKQSIGSLIYDAYMVLDMANLIAIIIIVVIIVGIEELVVKKLERKIMKAN